MQIQISWLLQKPTDLDLQCLQMQGISGFSRTRVNIKPCLSGFNVNSKIILQKSKSSSFSDFLIFGPTLSDLFWFLVLPHQIFFQVLVLPYWTFSDVWSYPIRPFPIFGPTISDLFWFFGPTISDLFWFLVCHTGAPYSMPSHQNGNYNLFIYLP